MSHHHWHGGLPPETAVVGSRGITRGPRIELVQPRETSHSPMRFQLKFQSFGGVAINIDSLRMVYLKTPSVCGPFLRGVCCAHFDHQSAEPKI
jgi:hypothetical protein